VFVSKLHFTKGEALFLGSFFRFLRPRKFYTNVLFPIFFFIVGVRTFPAVTALGCIGSDELAGNPRWPDQNCRQAMSKIPNRSFRRTGNELWHYGHQACTRLTNILSC